MLSAILRFYNRATDALEMGVELKSLKAIEVKNEIARMKEIPENEFDSKFEGLMKNIDSQFDKIVKDVGK
jgi:V/A-type H+-transporting ATPase subunit A